MSKINWSFINNGHAFQTLVSILVLHKDIEAKPYPRLGRDAGIDIESGDGKIIYQIKYISNQKNFSNIISKVKQELQKIKEYKNPSHKNFQYWSKAKEWHLITNASCNPQDRKKWKEQIEKPFLQETKLKVKLKHNTWLEKELLEFPALKTEYFGGENRVLLSLPEAIDSKKNDIIFSKGFNLDLIGRDEELKKFSDFIEEKDKKIILIHGQGGVGKTRFAIETAFQTSEQGYDIFWANTATMEKSTNWFQSIVPGRKTLLVIDEPEDQKLIEVLLEQTSSQRLSNWKFAIITRSAKDHILKPLNPNKKNTISDHIELFPLNKEPAEKIISALIEKSDILQNSKNINKLKSGISKLSGGIPIWVIISFKMFEKKGSIVDLPKDTYDLANNYIEECLSSPSENYEKSKLYKILKAIAILQPIYIEIVSQSYDYFKSLIEDITKPELEEIFKTLQEKKLASKRGRLLEIKPDVIRDYIILKRIGENREESKEWLEKILHMQDSEKKKSALKQLARIEYYHKFQGQTKTFLDPTWDIFITKAKENNLRELKDTFALAESISFSNLPKFIEFIQNIQINRHKKESVRHAWGEKGFLYLKDLILQSSWALYKAGVYAQSKEEAKSVFKELLNLAEKEQPFIKDLSPFPYSDSSRAVRVIERLMTKNLYYDNVVLVSKWIIEELDKINNLNEDKTAVLKILITECFFKLEKNIFESTDDNKFESRQFIFKPKSKLNECRNQIFEKIWSTLNSNQIQVEKRKYLWVTLKDYQKQINYRIGKTELEDIKNYQEKELEDNLNRIKKYLSEKEVSIYELSALRDIWKWQLKYDKRAVFKGLAQDCEKLLLEKNKVDSDFISLYDHALYDLKSKKIQDYSKKLDSKNKIHSFVEDNFNYSKNYPYILMNIARNLGGCEKLSNHVSNYIEEIIKSNKTDYHFEFVCEIILAHFDAKRNSKESAFDLLMYYWRHCKSIERKETFLNTMYHPKPKSNLEKEDIKFIFEILSQNDTILSKKLLYIISYFSGSILFLDFNQSKEMIEYVFQKSELNKRATLFKNFVEAINDRYSIKRYSQNLEEQSFKPRKDIFIWLIGLLQNIPSIDWLDIHGGEGLKELKEDLNVKFSVLDFVKILKERITIIEEKNDSLWKNIFVDQDFIKIIDPISEKDISSQQIKKSLNTLLASNNHPLLYYKLPSICIKIDPCGFLIPTLITEQITSKNFLWEKLKDIPPEGEWTRYAGYYPINSKQWREIAKTACKIAIDKTEKDKKIIFSSILDQEPQVIKGSLNEVAPYYHIKLDQAKLDFSNETDTNIKEFMNWRLKRAEKELKEEKQIIEENHG